MGTNRFALPSPGARPTGVRWLIFVLICAASWLLYLHRYSWGVIKPALRAENPALTDTEVGWLDAAFLATYAFGQAPTGLVADVFGARAVLVLILLLWSLTVVALGWAGGFWPLFGVRAAFGLGQAGAYPAIGPVTGRWFPAAVRTSVQGIITAMGRVGGACAPPIVATLLIGWCGLSWRVALLAIALPGALLALAFWLAFRNSPREHPGVNPAERDLIEAGSSPPAAGGGARLRLGGAAGFSLFMFLAYAFFATFADMLYVNWIPSFLVEGKRLSFSAMGWFAPLPLLGGAAGGVVGGVLNDVLVRRLPSRRWARSGVAFTGKLTAGALILASLAVADGRLVMVLLLVCKFFADWGLSTQWGATTDMGGRGAGTLFGVVNTAGSLGGFAAGPLMGYLKQHHGWEGLFLGVAAAYVAAALAWLFIDCTRRLVVDTPAR